MIPVNGIMQVNGRSQKLTLSSVPACQSVTKKTIIEEMNISYGINQFTEEGAEGSESRSELKMRLLFRNLRILCMM